MRTITIRALCIVIYTSTYKPLTVFVLLLCAQLQLRSMAAHQCLLHSASLVHIFIRAGLLSASSIFIYDLFNNAQSIVPTTAVKLYDNE
jgi:hypothetical protein